MFTRRCSYPGRKCTASVPWNTFGQRFYIQVVDQSGSLVLNTPLIASTTDYPINLVGGYFSGSSLVFFDASQTFVVTP